MALTADIKIIEYGSPDPRSIFNAPLPTGVTVYRGSIALTNGPLSSVTPGSLKNASVPTSTDVCWGVLDKYGPGTADTGPGMVGGTGVTCDVRQGTFGLLSGTGADLLSASTLGQTVYVINETTVGATSGSGTRPVAGVHVSLPTPQASAYQFIRLGSTQQGDI